MLGGNVILAEVECWGWLMSETDGCLLMVVAPVAGSDGTHEDHCLMRARNKHFRLYVCHLLVTA